jgi:hypothetical protein
VDPLGGEYGDIGGQRRTGEHEQCDSNPQHEVFPPTENQLRAEYSAKISSELNNWE